MTSPRSGALNQAAATNGHKGDLLGQGSSILQTFELHKDKGAITNLVCLYRPLSLFGLTANMKAYEPVQV